MILFSTASAFKKHIALGHWLVACVLIFSGMLVQAASIETKTDEEQLKQLAYTPQWLRLIHYYPQTLHSGHWKSQVDDPDFFLAKNGTDNPEAELKATITAFYSMVTTPDQHPICRFPARWYWLSKNIDLTDTPLTPAQCPELQQWLAAIKPHSVTLVFASSYLNSPSSMFGHTFLRIDPANLTESSDWLSFVVNFGAVTRAEDNSILYAWKGLFGGYPGVFSLMRYHEKINEYNRIENRDLWEYNLNLQPEEVQFLMLHIWDMRDIDFDYYFFDENCSFRLLELLEVTRPNIDLTSNFEMRAIPLDTVRAVIDAGLVSTQHYRPSAATRLQFQASQLTPAQQQLAWEVAHQFRSLNDSELHSLPTQQQADVLRLAYQHVRFTQNHSERDLAKSQHSLALLKYIQTLEVAEAKAAPSPTPPEQGHDTLLTGLAFGRSNGKEFADLHLRASYHDLTDNSSGYLRGAAINLGDLVLRQKKSESLQIEQLNFIDINSHSPRDLFFNPITWRIRTGLERLYNETDDTLAPHVSGGAGATYPLGENGLGYGLMTSRLEYNSLSNQDFGVAVGSTLGLLWFLGKGTLQFEAEYYQFADGNERHDLRLTHNQSFGKNDAIRLLLMQRQQLDTRFNEASLEYRHFF